MNPTGPRVVIPRTTRRDAIIGGTCGLLVLAFIAFGIFSLKSDSEHAQSNMITGVVVEKQFTAAPEEQISVGGKGLKIKRIEGEYVLKVQVGVEERVFEVPVDKMTYQSKRAGDSVTFLRPPSEQ